MTLFVKQLSGLFNGVSQQPATLRLPSQHEEVINCELSVVDGVSKRPPTEHVATFGTDINESAKLHILNRDTSHRYAVVITDGDLKVFDLAGNEIDVSFPSGKGYLASDNPRSDFECVSVADFTFIVNKSVIATMAAVNADLVEQTTTYWWLNRTASSDSLTTAQQKQYTTNPSGGRLRGGANSVSDIVTYGTDPQDGDIWKVAGESGASKFYVRRKDGFYEETVAPQAWAVGLKNLVDAETMPHALVLQSDGTFGFGPFSWAPRHVGDEDSNPNPSFVNRAIRDVFFYKNRLCFLADENIVASRSGDYGTFYKLTQLQTLPDQVIDIGVAGSEVSILNWAVPFNQGVMAFSDQKQFYVGSRNQETTSTSMSADVTTAYTCSQRARPVAIGSDIYFASETGDYATLWEYFVRDDTVTNDAANVTAHVPNYVPASITKLIASTDHDALWALASDFPSRLYYYKFYWQGDQKVQSAWSYWQFDENAQILDGAALDSYIYLIIKRNSETLIERIALQPGAHPTDLSFQVHLDRRTAVQGVYLDGEDKTEFLLPYLYDSGAVQIVHGGSFGSSLGSLIDPTTYTFPTAHTIKVPGDHSAGACHIGNKYSMKLTFSEQFVVDSNNAAVTTGRLQIRSFTLYYVNSGYFQTVVDPYGDQSQTEEVEVVPSRLSDFTGKTLGSTALIIGKPTFASGTYQFQVYAPATSAKVSIVNDSHVGCTLQKAEVELFYFNRAKVR